MKQSDQVDFDTDQIIYDSQYVIEEIIGQGQFGKVYKCNKITDGTKWAIKIQNTIDQQGVSSEVNIQEGKIHKNILQLIESKVIEKYLYIITELCDQGPLRTFLKKNQSLQTQERVDICQGICQGLKYLHDQNIMHRDLNIVNILMHQNVPKIGDFGFSKISKKAKTQLGTKPYTAPEILYSKKEYTNKADIYSLGVIVFYIFNATLPYICKNDDQLKQLQLQNQPQYKNNIHPILQNLINGMLKFDSQDRPNIEQIQQLLQSPSIISEQITEYTANQDSEKIYSNIYGSSKVNDGITNQLNQQQQNNYIQQQNNYIQQQGQSSQIYSSYKTPSNIYSSCNNNAENKTNSLLQQYQQQQDKEEEEEKQQQITEYSTMLAKCNIVEEFIEKVNSIIESLIQDHQVQFMNYTPFQQILIMKVNILKEILNLPQAIQDQLQAKILKQTTLSQKMQYANSKIQIFQERADQEYLVYYSKRINMQQQDIQKNPKNVIFMYFDKINKNIVKYSQKQQQIMNQILQVHHLTYNFLSVFFNPQLENLDAIKLPSTLQTDLQIIEYTKNIEENKKNIQLLLGI